MMQNKMQQKELIKTIACSFLVVCFCVSASFNKVPFSVSLDICKDINKALCKKNILLSTKKDSIRLLNDISSPIWIINQPKMLNNLRVATITVCCQTTYTSTTKPYRYCYSSTFYYKEKIIYVINQALEPQVWLDLKTKQKIRYLYPSSLGRLPILKNVTYCPSLKDSLYHIETSSNLPSHTDKGEVTGFIFSNKYGIIKMDYTIQTQGSTTYILK